MLHQSRHTGSWVAGRIALIYFLVSWFYILFTDRLIDTAFSESDPDFIVTISMIKGSLFVLFSALVIFRLIRRALARTEVVISTIEHQKKQFIRLAEKQLKTKNELKKRNKFIETILTNLPIGIAVNRLSDGESTMVNEEFIRVYEWSKYKHNASVSEFLEHVYGPNSPTSRQILEDLQSGDPGRLQWYGIRLQSKNGQTRIIDAQNIPVPDQDLMISTVRDVTKIKESEAKIRESEKRLRAMFESSLTAILMIDHNQKFRKVNKAAEKMFGYSQAEFAGMKVSDLTPGNSSRMAGIFHKFISEGVEKGNFEFLTKQGKLKFARFHSFNIEEDLNLSFLMDITDIITYQKKLRKLSVEEFLIEERQRKEIAANVHDHVGQSLLMAKKKLERLSNEDESLRSNQLMRQSLSLLNESLKNARNVMYDLSPPVLYELGLNEAILSHLDKIEENHDLQTTFFGSSNKVHLDENELIMVFRIIQELLNNVIKHSKATKVEVHIVDEMDKLRVRVVDDGIGVSSLVSKSIKSGFGLFLIRERIENLQGNLKINSTKSEGTIIEFSLPTNQLKLTRHAS